MTCGSERQVRLLKKFTKLSQRLAGIARTKTMPINIKTVPTDITENKVSFVVFTRIFGAVLNLFLLSRNRLCAVRAHKTFPASERGVYILNTHSLIHE